MKNIKYFEKVTSAIPDFSWIDIKFLIDFHFHYIRNEFFDNVPCVDAIFIIITKSNKKYKLQMKFSGINDSELASIGKYIQLTGFNIVDKSDDGWENISFKAWDYESDNIKLFCDAIEVISIEEISNVDFYLE